MKSYCAMLLIALAPASAWAKKGDCAVAQREYERTIAAIPQKCSSPSDCVDLGVLWSACWTPRFHSKDALDEPGKTALRALRDTKKRECGWVERPCPAIPILESQILCLKDQCSSTEEFFAQSKGILTLKLVDSKTGKPLAGAEITVLSGHVIYCVTTPCPEGRKTHVLKTDASGLLSLPRAVLSGQISLRLGNRGIEEKTLAELISLSGSELRL